jgi:bacterioferritin-associated ferredoxin
MTIENDDDDEIMCECTGTKRSDIERMYFDGLDLDKISSKTGVMTGCGGCEWEVESYLEALAETDKD